MKNRAHWKDQHLRCCLACGRVWRPRPRKTCPNGHPATLEICLTCHRAWPEEEIQEILDRRCEPPGEQIRAFVKRCGGDWEHARRRLTAAHGDLARAIVALNRARNQPGDSP